MKPVRFTIFWAMVIGMLWIKVSLAGEEGGIWVVEQSENNVVIKLSLDEKKELIRIAGFKVPTDIDVDSRDGSVWITDTANDRVVEYSNDGKQLLLELEGFDNPYHSVLDIKESTIWVASSLKGEVVKFSLDGQELLRIKGLGELHEIQLSPFDASIWVGDQTAGKFIRFSTKGEKLGFTQRRLGRPMHIAINPKDGSAWATFQYPGRAVKFSAQGLVLAEVNTFDKPYGVTINPLDDSVWVTDVGTGELTNISSDGKRILKKISGFDRCRGLSLVDAKERIFWMANWGAGEILKFSLGGEILNKIKTGGNPRFGVIYRKEGI